MLELAQLGARVMHPRAVELGEVYDMPILVRSSFSDAPGTLIHDGGERDAMEIRKNVRGIAHDTDVARITLLRVPDRPGIAARSSSRWPMPASASTRSPRTAGADGTTDLSFTVVARRSARRRCD